MNVNIMTLHNANNVGAFLQAFSLQTVLQQMGHNVSFMQFKSETKKSGKLSKVMYYLKQGKLALILFKYKSAKKYDGVYKYLNVNSDFFGNDKEYDTVVVGSDELWNVECPHFTHQPQFFGKDIKAKRLVAYAVSANNSSVSDIEKSGYDFNNFSYISVRDSNTYNLVKEMSNTDAEIVCDPTLLIDTFDDHIPAVDRNGYILVYSYGLTSKEIKAVKKFAKKEKKKLISVGTYNSWCDENVVADPFEFLGWLKNADYVVTSTFHGTVLSVKLHKQFVVFSQESHKVEYFIKQMSLENRDATSCPCIEDLFSEKINYAEVENKIQILRNKSYEYLKKALEE